MTPVPPRERRHDLAELAEAVARMDERTQQVHTAVLERLARIEAWLGSDSGIEPRLRAVETGIAHIQGRSGVISAVIAGAISAAGVVATWLGGRGQ